MRQLVSHTRIKHPCPRTNTGTILLRVIPAVVVLCGGLVQSMRLLPLLLSALALPAIAVHVEQWFA